MAIVKNVVGDITTAVLRSTVGSSGVVLALDSTPAGNTGWTVSGSTVSSIDMTGTTSRNHITWDSSTWGVGARIQCTATTAASLRVILRISDTVDLLAPVETLFDQTFTGAQAIDVTTTQDYDYFGFLTIATGDLDITNFSVTLA